MNWRAGQVHRLRLPRIHRLNQLREQDFDALPYADRRERTRKIIEKALQYVEAMGRPPENAPCNLLSGAMECFQEGNFWPTLVLCIRRRLWKLLACLVRLNRTGRWNFARFGPAHLPRLSSSNRMKLAVDTVCRQPPYLPTLPRAAYLRCPGIYQS